MRSPFPGMDPYLEACGLWEDFHSHLIERIYDVLAAVIPPRYFVSTGHRSYIVLAETEGKTAYPFKPDVGVTSSPGSETSGAQITPLTTEAVSETEAVPMRAFIEVDHRERFIEIYEAEPEQRLVTCIEALSPSNKRRRSQGWRKYLRKRRALLLGSANFVEIDLLRGGERMPMLDPWPNSPYTLLVAREEKAPHCRVWPAHFQHPLPVIPIPLAKPDPDIPLALQPLLDSIYERAGYDRRIVYTQALKPPLNSEESAWLEQQWKAQQSQP